MAMSTLAQLRAQAQAHARQIEAVTWLTVNDLAVRWGVCASTVRKIPRSALPYLALGTSRVRRYDPRDVEAYEAAQKGPEDAA